MLLLSSDMYFTSNAKWWILPFGLCAAVLHVPCCGSVLYAGIVSVCAVTFRLILAMF
jgi:hypothetical protein